MSRVGVVVAIQDGPDTSNLEAFARQAAEVGGRLILVDGSKTGIPDLASATTIRSKSGMLVPELWSVGLLADDSPFVVLTTSTMKPKPGWLANLLRAAETSHKVAIGGRILPGEQLAPLDSALYLARYLNYASPADGTLPAGENVIYRRAVLDRCRSAWAAGFWEAEVHAVLRREAPSAEFGLEPNAILEYSGGAAWGSTLVRRFRHGLRYGAKRAKGRIWALAAPLVPAALGLRIARTLRRVGPLPGVRYASVLPWMAVTTAWTLGECLGLATKPSQS